MNKKQYFQLTNKLFNDYIEEVNVIRNDYIENNKKYSLGDFVQTKKQIVKIDEIFLNQMEDKLLIVYAGFIYDYDSVKGKFVKLNNVDRISFIYEKKITFKLSLIDYNGKENNRKKH